MKEFGSDFHSLNISAIHDNTIFTYYPNAIFVADGRQAIELLIIHYKWKRIWIPEYFCWEIIEYIQHRCKIEVKTYFDNPLNEEIYLVEKLSFIDGDVLLRMNYFGLRQYRNYSNISIPVIEDHSHNIFDEWSQNSKADFCIASLRKTLPLAGGGMIWSNSHNLSKLSTLIENSHQNEQLARIRWQAMEDKAHYLSINETECNSSLKDSFRAKYIQTEEGFDHLPISRISILDKLFLEKFDINEWHNRKLQNWQLLIHTLSKILITKDIRIFYPSSDKCIPFSLLLLFRNTQQRDLFRLNLIKHFIYPAILWNLPENCSDSSKDISNRMLSIHCDGRYSSEDVNEMGNIIYNFLIHFDKC